ncbi:MAG: hypothetical protein KAG14_04740, partial [Mycoplasmataceae bacterium]|nr:hypothetical protein [Mycoplasmataceae bacterium]
DELQHLESTVDSIESLYKILQDDDNQTLNSQSLKLNISSGNILIIVDGLDEIESKLKERFNLEKFIKSVIELNHTFLNCSVIITARGNDPKKFYHDNINIYTLKGFDDDLVEKYLNKRFKNNSKSTNDVQSYISGLELENNKKVTPLIIKLICDFVESQGEDEIPNSDFNEKSKYFNLSNPLDIVVNQIISREIIKQDINISSDDYFEILKDIVFDYNCLISKKDLDELIECTLIDGRAGNTKNFTNFYVSPLLFRDKDNFRIKYDSLEFWIKSRYIAYRINNEKGESSNSVIEVLTRDCYKGGDLVNEISKFTKNNNTSYYVSVIKGCLDKLSKEECDNEIIYKKTISAILYLSMPKGSCEKLEYSELILELFNKGKGEVIQFLSIYGIFFPLDFNLFTVLNGYFDSYSNLSKSEIPKDKEIFIDCEFKNIDKSSFGKQHVQDINFRNCILPNTIKDLISTSKQTKQDQIDNIKNDLRKIFKVGFRQNTFHWKSEGLYRQQCASLKHKLVLSKYIQILVQESFFEIELEKASGGKAKGYKLPHNKEETIKDFLTQGIIKNEIKALIDKLIN